MNDHEMMPDKTGVCMQSLVDLLPELDRRYAFLRETLEKSTEQNIPDWHLRLARGDMQSVLDALIGDDEDDDE